ncbi:MAG: tetratricopeptide repeat protein [Gammaproteobacteria bacterium]|nr:tetratricopeptide repeat protein [Gammaproteobacteria bacterium]
MSLINQVLKDLEQRHANEMAEATHNLEGLALASPTIPAGTQRGKWWILWVVLLAGASVSAAWWWQQTSARKNPAIAQTTNTTPVMQSAALAAATKPSPVPASEPAEPAVSVAEKTEHAAPPKHVTAAKSEVQHRAVKDVKVAVTRTEKEGGVEKQMLPLRREQRAEVAYQEGYDRLALHKVTQAEQSLRQALVIAPDHVRARELLAGLLIQQGRWVETAELMKQGVQLLPANLVFVKLYARTLMQLNRDQQAITLLQQHAPGIAQDPDYYALLAALYQRQQNHLAAANTYSQILKLRPDTGIWWVGMGISLEALGKQQEAQRAYARARQTGNLRGDLARYTDNRLLALDTANYPAN